MSGENYIDTIESYGLSVNDWMDKEGTEYQKQGIQGAISKKVEEFDSKKLLTDFKRKKLLEKYYHNSSELNSYEDKYTLCGLNLGIVSWDKLKPVYRERTFSNYQKPQGSKKSGYSVVSVNEFGNKSTNNFLTLTEAKKYAKKQFLYNGCNQSICQNYTNKNDRIVGKTAIGYFVGEKVGEYKSLPKKTPASIFIKPKYLYSVILTLTDHQMEYR